MMRSAWLGNEAHKSGRLHPMTRGGWQGIGMPQVEQNWDSLVFLPALGPISFSVESCLPMICVDCWIALSFKVPWPMFYPILCDEFIFVCESGKNSDLEEACKTPAKNSQLANMFLPNWQILLIIRHWRLIIFCNILPWWRWQQNWIATSPFYAAKLSLVGLKSSRKH